MVMRCKCGRTMRQERERLDTCWECGGRSDECPFCGKPKRKENKRCRACRTQQTREEDKLCNRCGILLTDETWPKSLQRKCARQCRLCNNAEQKKWIVPEREALKRRKLKIQLMAAYGGRCVCCGETEIAFLTIDHVKGDGARHRKELRAAGGTLYAWLKKRNYPQGDYQCLCMNCNFAKSKNFWGCPHEQKRFTLVA